MNNNKIKILAIDDSNLNLVVLKVLIKEAFPEVVYLSALNGTKGIEIAASEDPDVILLDIMMPGMDGFEVCKRLKADKKLNDIPVVFVTSLNSEKDIRIRALEAGAEAFLSKPIDETELTAQIRAMVKIKTANIVKREEKKQLATLVLNRTRELEKELKQRILAEEALRRSEADLREAQRVGRLGSWEWDATTDTISWSEEYYRIYGFDPTQPPPGYEEHLKLYTPESAARLDMAVKNSMESGIPYELDLELAHVDSSQQWITARCEIKRDTNGQIVGLRGTAHDITERKLAEIELHEKEVQYRNLANSGLALIWTTDTDNSGNYFNEPWLKFTGRTIEQEMGNGWEEGVHPDDFDRCIKTYATAFDKCEKFEMEYRLRTASGEYRWIQELGTPNYNSNGKFIGYIGHCFDITERKKEEAEQRKIQDLLAISQKLAHIGSWETELSTGKLSWSDEMYHILGSQTGLPVNLDLATSVFLPDELVRFREAITSAIRGEKPYNIDFTIKRPDGQVIIIHDEGEVVFDEHNTAVRMFGTTQDITERRLAEDALRESRQIIEGIINAIPVRVFWKDRNLVYLGCNAAFASDAGYSDPKDIIGKDDYQMGWRDQAELYRSDDLQVIESGNSRLHIEEPQTTPEGNTITLLTSKIPLLNSKGDICGVLGTYMDITERKRAEIALIESENKYRLIAENTVDVIWIIDMNLKFTFVSPSILKFRGFTVEEAIMQSIDQILTPYSLQEVLKIFTEQISLFKYNPSNDNPSILIEMGQYKKDGSTILTDDQVLSPYLLQEVLRLFAEHRAPFKNNPSNETPSLVIEMEQYKKDGSIILTENSISLLFDEKKQAIGALGITRDITERKRVEEAIRESEEKFRSIAEQTTDLIALTDTNGFVTYASSASRALFQYAPEEMCGHHFTEFLEESETDKAITAFRAVLERNESTKDLELKMKRKDGSIFVGELNGSSYIGGEQNGTLVIIHDITGRKQSEEKMQESIVESGRSKVAALNLLEDLRTEMNIRKQAEIALIASKELLEKVNKHEIDIREEERAVISREIHDQLGQSMTALKMDLAWLQIHKSDKPESDKKMGKMNELIASTIKDIQRISSDLRPGILDDLGLASAIEWYCEEFANRSGLIIKTDIDEVQTEDPNKNITIYRVLQESLTNIIRHAKAVKAIIKLSQINNNIELTILDDGIGIKEEEIFASKSLGIQGMIERVKQCSGQMQISSPGNHGTEVKIIIPI